MSISDQITRLNNAKAAIKQSLENKGVTVSDSALLDEYPALISSIEVGSGEGGDPYYEDLYNLRTNNGTNMAGMFSYFTGSIDVSKFDTSKVTNVGYMFSNANTDKIILTGMSFPKCTKLDSMFSDASGTTLDLSSWDISNITNMSYMFAGYFKKIDLTGWNTNKVTNMGYMFYKSGNPLEELIIPDWDMTKVTSSSSFFGSSASYTQNLKLIDLSRSNDATITKITSYLPTRTATTFGTVLVPENTSQAAYDALVAKYWAPIGAAIGPAPTSVDIVAELDEIYPGKSTKVYIGACEPWNADTSKVELVLASDSSIATMTEDNEVISTGILGDIIIEARIIDTQEVVGTKTIIVSETDSYPNLIKFRVASKPSTSSTIITVNGSGKKLSNLTYDSITDIYSYDAGVPITKISFSSVSNTSELIKLNTSNVTDMGAMFSGCGNLTSLDVSNFDTSNVTTMYAMFSSCRLKTLDLSNFDTSNVTRMEYMFQNCNNLTSLDLSNFDTSNVTNPYDMFDGCTSLHTLRLDNWNNANISKIITSKGFPTNAIDGVTRTIYCKEENAAGLTPPTNWVFSYVAEDIPLYVPGEFQYTELTEVRTMVDESHNDLSWMFTNCMNLVSVNTEDWDTSNVENMNNMFSYCSSLQSLDLSNWDTSNVTDMGDMFSGCSNLTSLDVSNFDISNVTTMDSMFYCCSNLTSLDVSNWDISNVTTMDYMFYCCDLLHTLHLDNCSNATISKIITSSNLPTNTTMDGGTRTIYCKKENAAGLTPPEGWEFSYVD